MFSIRAGEHDWEAVAGEFRGTESWPVAKGSVRLFFIVNETMTA